MSLKFSKLTRPNMRNLSSGLCIIEHGINFTRLPDGDGNYTINIMVDGHRIHRVIGKESEGVTRKSAEDFIEQVKTEARNGRLNLPKGRKTILRFKQAAVEYLKKLKEEGGKDIPKKDQRLRDHLTPFFRDKPISTISTFDVGRYKKARIQEGCSPGTLNRELAVLSHLLNKAVEWQWLQHKPCIIKREKEDKGRITYLDRDQIERLLDKSKQDQYPHIYPFIVIGLDTSMRRSEILSIRIENIDLEKRVIYVPHAKSGAREQPITGNLVKFLQGYIEAAKPEQEWLFPSDKSRSGHVMNIEKPWKRVVKAADLDPKVIVRHTLRHTAITHLVQAGVDLPTVQRISGHKTLSMVVRYSHQSGTHIRAAMDKLERQYKGNIA
ncbi:MAG: tyrosine-type recombinase/integrase [Ignavibacteriaceae bacterium]